MNMENNNQFQNDNQKWLDMMPNYSQMNPNAFRVGFGKRLGAALIDALIILIILVIGMALTGIISEFSYIDFNTFATDPQEMKDFNDLIFKRFIPLQLVIGFVYYLLELFVAASPGKLILGLKIGSQNKTNASFMSLFIRFISKHIDFVTTSLFIVTAIELFSVLNTLLGIVVFVGCFFVFGEKKQALHDMIAKTAVYHKEDLEHEKNIQ